MATSDLHINTYRTSAVSVWIGDTLPRLEKMCIENNAKYFDDFFLLTDKKRGIKGTIEIVREDLLQIIESATPSEIKGFLPKPFKANFASDILTYFPFEVFKELVKVGFNLEIPKSLMYLDTDYFVYSKFIVKELVKIINEGVPKMMFLRDSNYYARYANATYVNSCWSLSMDANLEEKIESFTQYCSRPAYDRSIYGCIGPRYTNTEYWRRYAKVAPLSPHTFDPRYCYEGIMKEPIVKGALGIHLAKSLPAEVGFKLESIKLGVNQLSIEVSC